MLVKLSSRNYDIIVHGTVFLFDVNSDLTLNFKEDSFEFSLTINFLEDLSKERKVNTEIIDNNIRMNCINFEATGAGLTEPKELAIVNEKKIYITFWSDLYGVRREVRKVEYTVYSEK